jgi:hypothetical protein
VEGVTVHAHDEKSTKQLQFGTVSMYVCMYVCTYQEYSCM